MVVAWIVVDTICFIKSVLSNFDIGQERNQLKALYNYINPQILLPPRLRDISIIINSPKLQMYIHSLDIKKKYRFSVLEKIHPFTA